MNCYLYEGERLVFEGEGWGIIIDSGSKKRKVANSTYATHKACTISFKRSMLEDKDNESSLDLDDNEFVYGERCWHKSHSTLTCKVCSAPVPEGVQALILLQTWG